MPIYEYACGKCGTEFEVEQRITDDPIKTCPKCRSRKVKRLISRTSFVLKGGGWYSDLYSARSAKPADAKSEGKGDGAEAKTDAKKEPKAAPKSESKSESKPAKGDGPGKGPAARAA